MRTVINEKTKGDLGVLSFIKMATEKHFIVSIPFGDTDEYDVITDYNGILNRVQIKSIYTLQKDKDRYSTKIGRGNAAKKPYKNIDFAVIYISHEDTWYIIPFDKLQGVNCSVYPHRQSSGIYEFFKEKWDLLK